MSLRRLLQYEIVENHLQALAKSSRVNNSQGRFLGQQVTFTEEKRLNTPSGQDKAHLQ